MPKRPSNQTTIAQIAQVCGVSPATVSRVLYNRPHVAPELRRKIQNEITRCNYTFCHSSRSGKVLLILPEAQTMIHGEYYYEFINALQAAFLPGGYEVVCIRSAALPMIGNAGFDVSISLAGDPRILDYWSKQLLTPLIYVNWRPESLPPNCFSICADHRQALRDAVTLLNRNGHNRIGLMIVGHQTPDAQRIWEEREGFLDATARLGLEKSAWIEYTEDHEPHQALTNLLRRKITALICPSITEGGKVVRILQDLRLKIPEDLSVIVGESQFYDQINPIPLSALKMPYQAIAESCCAIATGHSAARQHRYELLQRESIMAKH